MESNGNILKYAANPRAFTLKKWFVELLQGRYPKNDAIIERISMAIATDKDLQEFGRLVIDVYETAYLKAVNDYKKEFERMGVKINIVPEDQSLKSGLISDTVAETK